MEGPSGEIFSASALLVSDLQSASATLSDLTLLGSDSSETSSEGVRAVRFLLAARSRVFRALLYGPFAESASNVVRLSHPTGVIMAIVEYCSSGQLLSFDHLGPDESILAYVGVVNAAHFYEMKDLEGRARRVACDLMEDRPALACPVLEATEISNCDNFSTPSSSASSSDDALSCLHDETAAAVPLRRRALDIVRYRTREALQPTDGCRGVLALGPSSIRTVMSDRMMHADETWLFRRLREWAFDRVVAATSTEERQQRQREDEPILSTPTKKVSPPSSETPTSDTSPSPSRPPSRGLDSLTSSTRKRVRSGSEKTGDDESKTYDTSDRMRIAQSIAKNCIRLSSIPPSELRSLVLPSGLVPAASIHRAFETQALRAERAGHSYGDPRSTATRRGRVVIRGAGAQAVNGTYTTTGTCDGVPKYCGVSTYRGREEVFTIFRYPSLDGKRRWYLSIVPTNFAPGSDDDHDFYFADCANDTPFGGTWRSKEEGVDPPPTCVWEADDFDDNDI